jgi:hypothetical protein
MYKLTIQQKNSLAGKSYIADNKFNPVQDINGDWFISEEEVSQAIYETWVKQLPRATFTPKPAVDIAETLQYVI